MKILFTGGSSFTGHWFIKELASAGHDVVATFRRQPHAYSDDLRRSRVAALTDHCSPVFDVSFGDARFMDLIKGGNWDLLCCHGAEVTNYNSPAFDVAAAIASNTHRLPLVLDALANHGCRKIVLTGSVFENDEGAGSDDRRAFSPYGLSKAMTWQMFRYETQIRSLTLGKFVIPNPFGPYEERRFTHYLMQNWFAGAIPAVNTPRYVRDNIHVLLLARTYAWFCANLAGGISRLNPSGYAETQGAFASRLADAMRKRLNLECGLELKKQTEYSEPYVRINTDSAEAIVGNWNEATAWDAFANYYSGMHSARKGRATSVAP